MTSRTNNEVSEVDVTELQHKDHQKVRNLFYDFGAAETGAEKEKLVKQIITELFVHLTAEEEVVYNAAERKADDAEDLIGESETEHRMVKHLMAELSQMEPTDDQFQAKVTVMCELVEHHVGEEEKELFKKLRESDIDLEALGEKFTKRKEELMGKPVPAMESTLTIDEKSRTARLPANGKAKPASRKTA